MIEIFATCEHLKFLPGLLLHKPFISVQIKRHLISICLGEHGCNLSPSKCNRKNFEKKNENLVPLPETCHIAEHFPSCISTLSLHNGHLAPSPRWPLVGPLDLRILG